MNEDTSKDGMNRPLKPYRILDGHAQYLTPDQQRDVMHGVLAAEKWRADYQKAKDKR